MAYQQQRFFLRTIVENDFKNGAKDLSNIQIKQIAKKSAERLLQSQLEEEKKKNESLENTISSHTNTIRDVRNQLKNVQEELNTSRNETEHLNQEHSSEIDRLTTLLSEKDSEVQEIRAEGNKKDDEIEKYRKKDFCRSKRNKIILLSFIILVILGHIVWYFIVKENSTSYMGMFVRWNSSLDEARAKFTVPIFGVVLTAILVPLCIALYKVCRKKYTPTIMEDKNK